MTRPARFITPNGTDWTMTGLAEGATTLDTPWLPFDQPVRETLVASPKKVWAHYFTSFPVKPRDLPDSDPNDYYNAYWLPPGAVEGVDSPRDHRPYGGFVRDRPVVNPDLVRPRGGAFVTNDRIDEIIAARNAGLDGFTVDLLEGSTSRDANWSRFLGLMNGIRTVGEGDFFLVPMPDGTANFCRRGVSAMTSDMLSVLDEPTLFRLDGQSVVAPFAPELIAGTSTSAAQSSTYWQQFLTSTAAAGNPVKLWPCFVNQWTDPECAPNFAPFSYGMSRWGDRNPAATGNMTSINNGAAPARSHSVYGKPWMHPVAPQDTRPQTQFYFEAWNTRNIRAAWGAAIDGGADWVQIPTWNDFRESACIVPSANHGYGWLDLCSYYLTWFKLGAAPDIVRDAIYLTHRVQHTDMTGADFTGPQTLFQNLQGGTPTKNEIEALAFLTAPSTVEITAPGQAPVTFSAPAGVSAWAVPLPAGQAGTPTARAIRSATTVTGTAVTGHPIVTSAISEDLDYRITSSLDADGSLRLT